MSRPRRLLRGVRLAYMWCVPFHAPWGCVALPAASEPSTRAAWSVPKAALVPVRCLSRTPGSAGERAASAWLGNSWVSISGLRGCLPAPRQERSRRLAPGSPGWGPAWWGPQTCLRSVLVALAPGSGQSVWVPVGPSCLHASPGLGSVVGNGFLASQPNCSTFLEALVSLRSLPQKQPEASGPRDLV